MNGSELLELLDGVTAATGLAGTVVGVGGWGVAVGGTGVDVAGGVVGVEGTDVAVGWADVCAEGSMTEKDGDVGDDGGGTVAPADVPGFVRPTAEKVAAHISVPITPTATN